MLEHLNSKGDEYSEMVQKQLHERASFCSIMMRNYQLARTHQEALCALNQKLYVDNLTSSPDLKSLPHSLVGYQLYQLGKVYSNRKVHSEAAKTLTRCLDLLEPVLSMKSADDGKMINQTLLMEIKEHLYSI